MVESVETLIVGGGQAGLAMAYHLSLLGREHLVLERGRIAERWRSERWDSLAFQFPNAMMRLPGYAYEGSDPDGFMPRDSVVRFIEEYARRTAPPIRCGVRVTAVRLAHSGRLLVETDQAAFEAANVVVATGPYQSPAIPICGAALPPGVCQVTANRYTAPSALPEGDVLVVGSGGSGCQIAEDLLRGGRQVFLSVRRHRRVPRRYRGKDFGWWQEITGRTDITVENLPADFRAPLLTGVDGGRTVDLRELAWRGLTLVGSLQDISGGRLHFASDLEENLARGDEKFDQFVRAVDDYISAHGIDAPPEPPRPDAHDRRRSIDPSIGCLDIGASGIRSVIWATGYRYDFDWIDCPVFDPSGRPLHRRGATAVPGLYFLGLPRLHKVKSAFLWGVGEDAEYLARHIAARQ